MGLRLAGSRAAAGAGQPMQPDLDGHIQTKAGLSHIVHHAQWQSSQGEPGLIECVRQGRGVSIQDY